MTSPHPDDCDCEECCDTVVWDEPTRDWDPSDIQIEFDENWWDEL